MILNHLQFHKLIFERPFFNLEFPIHNAPACGKSYGNEPGRRLQEAS